MYTPSGDEDKDLQLLKSLHDFYEKKANINENNILIQYLKDPKIIKKKTNLSLFIEELSNQITNGNTIILPFIDPCYDLIEAYINSDYDKTDIFKQLIENSFINRKILIPLYAYFTELYSEAEKLTQSDKKLNNFTKIVNLWKLFYSLSEDKTKNSTQLISSFCFLGTGLEIEKVTEFLDCIDLNVAIIFLNNDFLKYINENDYIITTEKKNIKYSTLLNYKNEKNNENISSINFVFRKINDKIFVEFYINKNLINIDSDYIKGNDKKICILNNFYGQLKSIEISLSSYKNQTKYYLNKIFPFPLKKNGGIIYNCEIDLNGGNYKKTITDNVLFGINNSNEENDNLNYNIYDKDNDLHKMIKLKLKIKEENLVKVNYINYKEDKFNIIDYFGGITQFLPFLNIVNSLYKNKNIEIINNQKKEDVLIDFAKEILFVIFNHLNNYGKQKQDYFKNYWIFYLYIINKIELLGDKNIKINIEDIPSLKTTKKENEIFPINFNDFLNYIIKKDKNNEESLKKSLFYIYFQGKKPNNNPYINSFGKTNNQLYRNIMKQLFVYNRLWSKQYLFFTNVLECYKNNNNKDLKIKYKRINYYTSNFQQPLIYPILEIDNYYPDFTKFNKENNLYKNNNEILKYEFSLDKFNNNLNKELINNYFDNNNTNNTIKCCLIKKMYHIKGELGILDNKIFFSSAGDEYKEKCNKINNNSKEAYNHDLCYGSVFPCLQKDRKRFIFIPLDKIMFAIIRIYYYRPSGLEIFTFDNKSYYFNFWDNITKNHRLIKFLYQKKFLEISLKYNNGWFSNLLKPSEFEILGIYNPKYFDILYPLFKDDSFINIWDDKKNYYSNFDKLMIINLFSNRSFNDLYQYPVFPMLYDEIKEKRKMNEPIGFQDLTKESRERKQLIIDSFNYAMEEEGDNDKYYFNLFFSNITYTCNYLIRVLPYSFIGIEYQGDGFDDPNRLFFSINSTFYNTLNQRADLRELIPEIFYFPPLFYNINEFNLKKIISGQDIDNVVIHDWNENSLKKYIFLRNMREYLEKEEKLNDWIDLIFGVNKEFRSNNGGKTERYYNKNNNVNFIDYENNLKNDLIMQSYDFGVLPFQLFFQNFPENIKISEYFKKEIYKYNKREFNMDHIECLINGKESFICQGEKGINNEYFKIMKKMQSYKINLYFKNIYINIDEEKSFNNIFYLFVGDVFGNLSVYVRNEKKDLVKLDNKPFEASNDKIILDKINNKYYDLLRILNDHTSEIKYIDYNPRLNLLVDYALDGFINLYTMPTLKLILSIQLKDFGIKEAIDINYVVLISNPFPMICCLTSYNIIIFDINGKLMNKLEIKEGININFYIDKNCGLFNDLIGYVKNGEDYFFDLFKEQ